MFHVSMLKKCVGDPSLVVPLENVAFWIPCLMRKSQLRFWIGKSII